MITLLDGGMGGELARRGVGDPNGLWSARALLDAPEAVVEVHRDYIEAGAEIIITNSYSTIPSYLGKAGFEDRYVELTALAGELARQAVDRPGVRVAGSLPPLAESYRPDLVPPEPEASPIYAAMAKALAPNVDLIICETMSTADEARVACAAAAAHTDRPILVSWTLNERPGGGLRSGERIADAVEVLAGLPIAGFLFNCTQPQAITAGLAELRELTDEPIGGYPNRMNPVAADWTLDNEVQTGLNEELGIDAFVAFAREWADLGARMIGGCCGIGPEYIAALRAEFANR